MTPTPPLGTIGKRYRLHKALGHGGMGIVYSATDRLTGQSVALKRVVAPTEQLIFDSGISDGSDLRRALAQEFKLLASLRHPNIISVLDYGFDENGQPYFVMELLENAHHLLDAARDKPVGEQVEMLVQIFQALAYLHRRGILHRDLKPGNVLVADGRVKLLDFGLSLAKDQSDIFAGGTAGTLSYMAPEVISGGKVSPASDLYAAGIMAYQMFSGAHPFESPSLSQMIDRILTEPPDIDSLGLDPRLAVVLARLLDKDPATRYRDANEILAQYAQTTNQPHLLDTAAIRESFLQAAHFVGRGSEFAQLNQALLQTHQGHGSAWLVGGESGVGKSRLLDELRIQALVEGAWVLRGQATSGSQVLYEIWREPIRWLSLEAQLDDLEASVLKTLVPDINRLLERDVPDAPELDAQSAQDRLLNVIENLIRSQQHPLVIILEDLHWISSESLKVLSRLIRGIENLPILIVASYRDDEAPKLPNQLPFMQVIKLHRLPPDDIAALSESMLGEAGRAEHIVEFLNRETEGNVFFIVEVVRTLAEEAGTLHDIAHKTLPQSVFAGGMQRIVQRRLNRVPKDAHLLLQAMAVAGRRLDLRLLQTVKNQHPDIYSRYLETWLEVCSNAAVLEVQDGEWRFAHDKLREGLLANLSPDETRRINRQVAEALEVLYADNPAYAAALADHWYKADESPKAIHYLDLAGAQAVASFANQEAIMYLARAQELDEAVPTRDNLLRRAYRESLLGQACLGAGRLEDSRTHLRKALALLKQPIPPSKRRLILSLLGQVAVQIEHRLIPSRLARFDEAGGADLLEAARIYEKMAELFYFQGDDVSTLYCSIRTLNMAERVEPSPELARAYGNLTVATGLVGLHNLSKVYHQRAQDIVARIDNIQTQSRVMSRTALAASGRGELSIADPLIRRSVELAEQIGDPRQWGEANAIYLNILYLQGKFEQSRHLCAQLLEHGTRRGDSQHRHWGMMWGMMNALALDLVDEAEALSLQALEYLAESSIPKLDEILERGFIALVWLRRGRLEEARGMVDRAFPLGVIIPHASSFAQCEAFASKAQVYLTLLDLTPEPDPRLLAEAQGGVRVIQAYAKRFAIGEPRAGKLAGWLEIHQGNPGKAHAIWEKALARALEFQLPYEQAHLHYQIGRHLPKGDPHRREHLQQAVELYTRLGNPYRAGLAEME